MRKLNSACCMLGHVKIVVLSVQVIKEYGLWAVGRV